MPGSDSPNITGSIRRNTSRAPSWRRLNSSRNALPSRRITTSGNSTLPTNAPASAPHAKPDTPSHSASTNPPKMMPML
jgi:hypothetical protein